MSDNDTNEPEKKEIEEKTSSNNDKNSTVVVTGASGFIASHTIVKLLAKGYNVIGTVRSKPDSDKYEWLRKLDTTNGKKLTLVSANLLSDGAFDNCISTADYVLHLASPYVISVNDPQKDLVDPALNGTINVLNACLKSKTVKKVVVTSSMAAITDEPVKKYTEEDWNEKSSLNRSPYYYSKVLAEKEAWKIYKEKNPSWKLVTINPWIVIGPELHDNSKYNTSNGTIFSLINGEYPTKLNLEFGIVDVRDVAQSHIIVMENDKSEGRHIVCNITITFDELNNYLGELCDEYNIVNKLPNCNCACNCCCFLWCMACCQPGGIRDFMRTHINAKIEFDNSKIKSLGLNFIDYKKSIKDCVQWGKKSGCLKSNN